MPETTTQVHAHEFLNLVGDHNGKLSETELCALAKTTFGAEARFFACFGDDLTLEQLVPALFEREKIALNDGKVELQRQNMC